MMRLRSPREALALAALRAARVTLVAAGRLIGPSRVSGVPAAALGACMPLPAGVAAEGRNAAAGRAQDGRPLGAASATDRPQPTRGQVTGKAAASPLSPGDALEAIIESLDVIHVAPDLRPGRQHDGELVWCVVALPPELVDWLRGWRAELAEVEDDDHHRAASTPRRAVVPAGVR